MNIVTSELVGNRSDLAKLCNTRKFTLAVEVGTDRGMFAREFLDKWRGEMLYCVDPYLPYEEMPWDRQGDLLVAVHTLSKHLDRVRFVKEKSLDVVAYFGNVRGWPNQIDFAYIDGAHDLDSAYDDVEAWWQVVRPDGGILAGDDYESSEHPGVAEAVHKFAALHGLQVNLTTDYDRARSWYLEKFL